MGEEGVTPIPEREAAVDGLFESEGTHAGFGPFWGGGSRESGGDTSGERRLARLIGGCQEGDLEVGFEEELGARAGAGGADLTAEEPHGQRFVAVASEGEDPCSLGGPVEVEDADDDGVAVFPADGGAEGVVPDGGVRVGDGGAGAVLDAIDPDFDREVGSATAEVLAHAFIDTATAQSDAVVLRLADAGPPVQICTCRASELAIGLGVEVGLKELGDGGDIVGIGGGVVVGHAVLGDVALAVDGGDGVDGLACEAAAGGVLGEVFLVLAAAGGEAAGVAAREVAGFLNVGLVDAAGGGFQEPFGVGVPGAFGVFVEEAAGALGDVGEIGVGHGQGAAEGVEFLLLGAVAQAGNLGLEGPDTDHGVGAVAGFGVIGEEAAIGREARFRVGAGELVALEEVGPPGVVLALGGGFLDGPDGFDEGGVSVLEGVEGGGGFGSGGPRADALGGGADGPLAEAVAGVARLGGRRRWRVGCHVKSRCQRSWTATAEGSVFSNRRAA